MKTAGNIAYNLYIEYYNFYCYVAFDFIREAVENTLNDGVNADDLNAIHKHIKSNYI